MQIPARIVVATPDNDSGRYVDLKPFLPRVEELKKLEGWYNTGLYKFKVSCKFNDILRCARTSHFLSCFRSADEYKGRSGYFNKLAGGHEIQPLLRCFDPNWAIIFTPDKKGDMLGRCFLRWVENPCRISINNSRGSYELGRVYGNALNEKDILDKLKFKFDKIEVRTGIADTYL